MLKVNFSLNQLMMTLCMMMVPMMMMNDDGADDDYDGDGSYIEILFILLYVSLID